MTSTGAMSKLLQTLTPRPITPRCRTPDLTSLDMSDAGSASSLSVAPPLVRQRPLRSASCDEIAGAMQAAPSAKAHPPTRPAPPPPCLRPSFEDAPISSKMQTSPLTTRPAAARDQPLMLSPAPPALPPVEPLRTVSSAHQWLARYLLAEPAPYGPMQLLAEDMLGAGILGASVTGARPLVRPRGSEQQRPFDQFRGFVESLGRWVDEGPVSKRAMYQVFAMKVGRMRMQYARTLEVQCLGVETLPHVLGECTHLQKMDARGNCLKDLPASFGNLHALRELNLESNLFTRVPDALGQLSLDWLRLDVASDAIASPARSSMNRQGHPGWL